VLNNNNNNNNNNKPICNAPDASVTDPEARRSVVRMVVKVEFRYAILLADRREAGRRPAAS